MAAQTPHDQVLHAEQLRCRALEAGDTASLGQLLATGYRHVHGNGEVERRDEYLSRLGRGGYRRIERSELAVEVYGELATISGLSVTTVQPAPEVPRRRITGRALQVWLHEDRCWRQVAFQMTLTGPPTEVAQ
jgi:hypothetical protein